MLLEEMEQSMVFYRHSSTQIMELVVLPFGTGNDFCRTLTKEKNIQKILIQSLQQSSQKVDTIQINNRYYLNSACFVWIVLSQIRLKIYPIFH